MSRSLWFAAGAGAGVYAVVRARRVAELATVDGLRDRVGAAVVGLRMFRDEVAQGKAEAETDLRERMGLVLHEHGAHRALTSRPGHAGSTGSTGSTGSAGRPGQPGQTDQTDQSDQSEQEEGTT